MLNYDVIFKTTSGDTIKRTDMESCIVPDEGERVKVNGSVYRTVKVLVDIDSQRFKIELME